MSEAERKIARTLKAIEGPEDSVAFHSVMLRSHATKQQAEADFIILWKNVVIVVEVKGGGVSKHHGSWWSVDRGGRWHQLKESPMSQAQSAMFAFRSILQQEGFGWFAHEAIVITPDTDAPPPSIGWKSTHWLAKDQANIAGLTAALDAITSDARVAPASAKRVPSKKLMEQLYGEFTLLPVVDAQRGAVLEEQNRATEEQARVLASLARNQRMLVFGGAGTGKSLVLAEAAKLEASAGRSVLITFHSPALADLFAPLVAGRAIDVIPFDQLASNLVYDAVLVDEAQDLMTAEAMDLLDRVIAGGRPKGRWRLFLDPNNQAHVDGGFDKDVFDLIAEEAPMFDLNRNVRNTKAIVSAVKGYLGADVGDPGIVHGEKIQWHGTEDADVSGAVDIARELVEKGVARRDIWIISVAANVASETSQNGFAVKSPKQVKGLEVEHVIVCDLPGKFDDTMVASFYVSITRARVSLHILATKADKRRLQELAQLRGVFQ
ncbi:NERD domain-containing protein [Nocardia salmonicida]|uniref:nuclease-related domain-containing DEAD/DEAH box helicase n=1 Tax=Nocardia salmonicida TaxID=53431 RepID=UPI0037B686BB